MAALPTMGGHIYFASQPPSKPRDVVLTAAIADMEFARSSHLAWAEHLEAHVVSDEPCEQCAAKPYKLNAAHEREWVQKYDRVLRLLTGEPR